MGDIRVDNIYDPNHLKHEVLSTGQANDDGFKSFEIGGLASNHTTTATGLRHEILLLSWLIVLLRTREGSQTCYDWAYKSETNDIGQELVIRNLSMDEVITGLQSSIGEAAAVISRHITTAAPTQMSSPVSLLLSTSTLSRTSEEPKDDVSK